MTEHEKNNLDELKDIDEAAVEEISSNYPMLGKSAKKSILEKCLEKTEEAGFETNGITVSGTEVYHRPMWRRIAGSAAAVAAAVAACRYSAGASESRSVIAQGDLFHGIYALKFSPFCTNVQPSLLASDSPIRPF